VVVFLGPDGGLIKVEVHGAELCIAAGLIRRCVGGTPMAFATGPCAAVAVGAALPLNTPTSEAEVPWPERGAIPVAQALGTAAFVATDQGAWTPSTAAIHGRSRTQVVATLIPPAAIRVGQTFSALPIHAKEPRATVVPVPRRKGLAVTVLSAFGVASAACDRWGERQRPNGEPPQFEFSAHR
jgi:hypothetical protein